MSARTALAIGMLLLSGSAAFAQNSAVITQTGRNNNAGTLQVGRTNQSVIDQLGRNNNAAAVQFGRTNGAGITQQGRNNNAAAYQVRLP